MAMNNKLTGVIRGRAIQDVASVDGTLTILFDDGSTMTVQTADGPVPNLGSGKVKSVWQEGTTLTFGFEDGTKCAVEMEEETSSVMLRDRDQSFEYAN